MVPADGNSMIEKTINWNVLMDLFIISDNWMSVDHLKVFNFHPGAYERY